MKAEQRAQQNVVTWRAPWQARLVTGATAGVFLWLAGTSWRSSPPPWPGWAQCVCRDGSVALCLLAAVRFLAYIALVRITLTQDSVIVRNTLHTRRIALAEIEAVHGSFKGVVIKRAGAAGVRAEAAPFSISACLRHPRGRSAQIAGIIAAARER